MEQSLILDQSLTGHGTTIEFWNSQKMARYVGYYCLFYVQFIYYTFQEINHKSFYFCQKTARGGQKVCEDAMCW